MIQQPHENHPGHEARTCPLSLRVDAQTSRTSNGYACRYTGGHCVPDDCCAARLKDSAPLLLRLADPFYARMGTNQDLRAKIKEAKEQGATVRKDSNTCTIEFETPDGPLTALKALRKDSNSNMWIFRYNRNAYPEPPLTSRPS